MPYVIVSCRVSKKKFDPLAEFSRLAGKLKDKVMNPSKGRNSSVLFMAQKKCRGVGLICRSENLRRVRHVLAQNRKLQLLSINVLKVGF